MGDSSRSNARKGLIFEGGRKEAEAIRGNAINTCSLRQIYGSRFHRFRRYLWPTPPTSPDIGSWRGIGARLVPHLAANYLDSAQKCHICILKTPGSCYPGPECQHDMHRCYDKLLFPITIYWPPTWQHRRKRVTVQ